MAVLASQKILRSREKVLRAATALFAAKGFHETSTRDVARRARVNEVTVFRLFRNKQDLYLSVLEGKMGSDLPKWLGPVFASHPDNESMFLSVAERLQELFDPIFLRLLFFAALEKPSILKKRFRPRLLSFYELLGQHIQAQINNGVLRSLHPSFMGRALVAMIVYQELFCEFLGDGDFQLGNPKESIRAYTDIWLHGVSAGRSAPERSSKLLVREPQQVS
ncbi:MAG: TetR/AcrR family transcriptional regulator [Acidobacteria bacterium]|nr:TetR/AcrR family transcriptional regulator [Acidobacteriaceae bacterium]MBV9607980.1 TetR/AcrR family transcriptional regulator [Acidobacteriota bacterium]